MAEEQTVSWFSWVNMALRTNQKVSTLVRLTQVRQHYLHEQGTKKIKYHPTVKFRDMRKTVESLRKKKTRGSEAGPESNSDSDSEGDSDTDSEDETTPSELETLEESTDSGKLGCMDDLGVDLTSLELCDHLADTPLISSPVQKTSQATTAKSSTTAFVVLTNTDWNMS
ncbi:hypothetical protein QCA50_007959 [Cerrena zonata]|uniref:Uncharacterized protein n=1 Tax=Cerrena zonata TaxID=2478898 RepID=A0AAW0GGN0_9APHY